MTFKAVYSPLRILVPPPATIESMCLFKSPMFYLVRAFRGHILLAQLLKVIMQSLSEGVNV